MAPRTHAVHSLAAAVRSLLGPMIEAGSAAACSAALAPSQVVKAGVSGGGGALRLHRAAAATATGGCGAAGSSSAMGTAWRLLLRSYGSAAGSGLGGGRSAGRAAGGILLSSSSGGGGGGGRGVCGSLTRAGRSWGGAGGGAAVRTLWQDNRGYQHFEGRGRAWPFTGRRAAYTAGALAAGGAAYYLYCLEEVPYTGRRHSIMLVSAANEKWMGRMVFEEQKTLARAEGRLLPDSHPDVQRVRRLGQAIAAVAGDGAGGGAFQHMRDLDWEFVVIDSPVPNAFVVPGGKVVVFRGLLRLLGGSDDQLAAVLAHEVGHVLARHTAERLSTLNVWTLLNMMMSLTLGFGLPDAAMYMGIFLPYSRLAEHEADAIGLRLMSRACFDPAAAPAMLAKLNSKEKQMQQRAPVSTSVPYFLRTHPLTEDRVALVEQQLPQAVQAYVQAGCEARRSAFNRGMAAWGASAAPEEDGFRFG